MTQKHRAAQFLSDLCLFFLLLLLLFLCCKLVSIYLGLNHYVQPIHISIIMCLYYHISNIWIHQNLYLFIHLCVLVCSCVCLRMLADAHLINVLKLNAGFLFPVHFSCCFSSVCFHCLSALPAHSPVSFHDHLQLVDYPKSEYGYLYGGCRVTNAKISPVWWSPEL